MKNAIKMNRQGCYVFKPAQLPHPDSFYEYYDGDKPVARVLNQNGKIKIDGLCQEQMSLVGLSGDVIVRSRGDICVARSSTFSSLTIEAPNVQLDSDMCIHKCVLKAQNQAVISGNVEVAADTMLQAKCLYQNKKITCKGESHLTVENYQQNNTAEFKQVVDADIQKLEVRGDGDVNFTAKSSEASSIKLGDVKVAKEACLRLDGFKHVREKEGRFITECHAEIDRLRFSGSVTLENTACELRSELHQIGDKSTFVCESSVVSQDQSAQSTAKAMVLGSGYVRFDNSTCQTKELYLDSHDANLTDSYIDCSEAMSLKGKITSKKSGFKSKKDIIIDTDEARFSSDFISAKNVLDLSGESSFEDGCQLKFSQIKTSGVHRVSESRVTNVDHDVLSACKTYDELEKAVDQDNHHVLDGKLIFDNSQVILAGDVTAEAGSSQVIKGDVGSLAARNIMSYGSMHFDMEDPEKVSCSAKNLQQPEGKFTASHALIKVSDQFSIRDANCQTRDAKIFADTISMQGRSQSDRSQFIAESVSLDLDEQSYFSNAKFTCNTFDNLSCLAMDKSQVTASQSIQIDGEVKLVDTQFSTENFTTSAASEVRFAKASHVAAEKVSLGGRVQLQEMSVPLVNASEQFVTEHTCEIKGDNLKAKAKNIKLEGTSDIKKLELEGDELLVQADQHAQERISLKCNRSGDNNARLVTEGSFSKSIPIWKNFGCIKADTLESLALLEIVGVVMARTSVILNLNLLPIPTGVVLQNISSLSPSDLPDLIQKLLRGLVTLFVNSSVLSLKQFAEYVWEFAAFIYERLYPTEGPKNPGLIDLLDELYQYLYSDKDINFDVHKTMILVNKLSDFVVKMRTVADASSNIFFQNKDQASEPHIEPEENELTEEQAATSRTSSELLSDIKYMLSKDSEVAGESGLGYLSKFNSRMSDRHKQRLQQGFKEEKPRDVTPAAPAEAKQEASGEFKGLWSYASEGYERLAEMHYSHKKMIIQNLFPTHIQKGIFDSNTLMLAPSSQIQSACYLNLYGFHHGFETIYTGFYANQSNHASIDTAIHALWYHNYGDQEVLWNRHADAVFGFENSSNVSAGKNISDRCYLGGISNDGNMHAGENLTQTARGDVDNSGDLDAVEHLKQESTHNGVHQDGKIASGKSTVLLGKKEVTSGRDSDANVGGDYVMKSTGSYVSKGGKSHSGGNTSVKAKYRVDTVKGSETESDKRTTMISEEDEVHNAGESTSKEETFVWAKKDVVNEETGVLHGGTAAQEPKSETAEVVTTEATKADTKDEEPEPQPEPIPNGLTIISGEGKYINKNKAHSDAGTYASAPKGIDIGVGAEQVAQRGLTTRLNQTSTYSDEDGIQFQPVESSDEDPVIDNKGRIESREYTDMQGSYKNIPTAKLIQENGQRYGKTFDVTGKQELHNMRSKYEKETWHPQSQTAVSGYTQVESDDFKRRGHTHVKPESMLDVKVKHYDRGGSCSGSNLREFTQHIDNFSGTADMEGFDLESPEVTQEMADKLYGVSYAKIDPRDDPNLRYQAWEILSALDYVKAKSAACNHMLNKKKVQKNPDKKKRFSEEKESWDKEITKYEALYKKLQRKAVINKDVKNKGSKFFRVGGSKESIEYDATVVKEWCAAHPGTVFGFKGNRIEVPKNFKSTSGGLHLETFAPLVLDGVDINIYHFSADQGLTLNGRPCQAQSSGFLGSSDGSISVNTTVSAARQLRLWQGDKNQCFDLGTKGHIRAGDGKGYEGLGLWAETGHVRGEGDVSITVAGSGRWKAPSMAIASRVLRDTWREKLHGFWDNILPGSRKNCFKDCILAPTIGSDNGVLQFDLEDDSFFISAKLFNLQMIGKGSLFYADTELEEGERKRYLCNMFKGHNKGSSWVVQCEGSEYLWLEVGQGEVLDVSGLKVTPTGTVAEGEEHKRWLVLKAPGGAIKTAGTIREYRESGYDASVKIYINGVDIFNCINLANKALQSAMGKNPGWRNQDLLEELIDTLARSNSMIASVRQLVGSKNLAEALLNSTGTIIEATNKFKDIAEKCNTQTLGKTLKQFMHWDSLDIKVVTTFGKNKQKVQTIDPDSGLCQDFMYMEADDLFANGGLISAQMLEDKVKRMHGAPMFLESSSSRSELELSGSVSIKKGRKPSWGVGGNFSRQRQSELRPENPVFSVGYWNLPEGKEYIGPHFQMYIGKGVGHVTLLQLFSCLTTSSRSDYSVGGGYDFATHIPSFNGGGGKGSATHMDQSGLAIFQMNDGSEFSIDNVEAKGGILYAPDVSVRHVKAESLETFEKYTAVHVGFDLSRDPNVLHSVRFPVDYVRKTGAVDSIIVANVRDPIEGYAITKADPNTSLLSQAIRETKDIEVHATWSMPYKIPEKKKIAESELYFGLSFDDMLNEVGVSRAELDLNLGIVEGVVDVLKDTALLATDLLKVAGGPILSAITNDAIATNAEQRLGERLKGLASLAINALIFQFDLNAVLANTACKRAGIQIPMLEYAASSAQQRMDIRGDVLNKFINNVAALPVEEQCRQIGRVGGNIIGMIATGKAVQFAVPRIGYGLQYMKQSTRLACLKRMPLPTVGGVKWHLRTIKGVPVMVNSPQAFEAASLSVRQLFKTNPQMMQNLKSWARVSTNGFEGIFAHTFENGATGIFITYKGVTQPILLKAPRAVAAVAGFEDAINVKVTPMPNRPRPGRPEYQAAYTEGEKACDLYRPSTDLTTNPSPKPKTTFNYNYKPFSNDMIVTESGLFAQAKVAVCDPKEFGPGLRKEMTDIPVMSLRPFDLTLGSRHGISAPGIYSKSTHFKTVVDHLAESQNPFNRLAHRYLDTFTRENDIRRLRVFVPERKHSVLDVDSPLRTSLCEPCLFEGTQEIDIYISGLTNANGTNDKPVHMRDRLMHELGEAISYDLLQQGLFDQEFIADSYDAFTTDYEKVIEKFAGSNGDIDPFVHGCDAYISEEHALVHEFYNRLSLDLADGSYSGITSAAAPQQLAREVFADWFKVCGKFGVDKVAELCPTLHVRLINKLGESQLLGELGLAETFTGLAAEANRAYLVKWTQALSDVVAKEPGLLSTLLEGIGSGNESLLKALPSGYLWERVQGPSSIRLSVNVPTLPAVAIPRISMNKRFMVRLPVDVYNHFKLKFSSMTPEKQVLLASHIFKPKNISGLNIHASGYLSEFKVQAAIQKIASEHQKNDVIKSLYLMAKSRNEKGLLKIFAFNTNAITPERFSIALLKPLGRSDVLIPTQIPEAAIVSVLSHELAHGVFELCNPWLDTYSQLGLRHRSLLVDTFRQDFVGIHLSRDLSSTETAVKLDLFDRLKSYQPKEKLAEAICSAIQAFSDNEAALRVVAPRFAKAVERYVSDALHAEFKLVPRQMIKGCVNNARLGSDKQFVIRHWQDCGSINSGLFKSTAGQVSASKTKPFSASYIKGKVPLGKAINSTGVFAKGQESLYIPAPKEIKGFPGLKKVKGKTCIQGSNKLRSRWIDEKGTIFEWDSMHGRLEKYNKQGIHMGEFDADTGRMVNAPIPGRTTKRK